MIGAWLTPADSPAPYRHRASTVRTALFAVALPALLLGQVPNVSPDSGPATPVKRLHDSLADAGEPGAGLPERYQQLAPAVRTGFDFPLIASLVLGRNWQRLSAAQQAGFIDRLTAVSIATYARRFPDGGARFRHQNTVPLRQGRMLVKTELAQDTSDKVYLDYLVHRGADGNGWTIIGVIADGVNELALKRGEYGAIVKRKGFDGLIAELDRQIAEFSP